MIWKTTNALGQEVTWYSEDEIKIYEEIIYQLAILLGKERLKNER